MSYTPLQIMGTIELKGGFEAIRWKAGEILEKVKPIMSPRSENLMDDLDKIELWYFDG